MSSWRRRIRRKKYKLFYVLSVVACANWLFPQHAVAAEPKPSMSVTPTGLAIQRTAVPDRSNGAPKLPTASPAPAKKVIRVYATAYTSSVDETDVDPWTTASGAKAGDGIIAANGLPFGTRVRIPDHYGDKVFVVQDRMHPRYGRSYIDIWMPSKQQAKQWGVRGVKIEVL